MGNSEVIRQVCFDRLCEQYLTLLFNFVWLSKNYKTDTASITLGVINSV